MSQRGRPLFLVALSPHSTPGLRKWWDGYWLKTRRHKNPPDTSKIIYIGNGKNGVLQTTAWFIILHGMILNGIDEMAIGYGWTIPKLIQFNIWILPKNDSIQYSIQYNFTKIQFKKLFNLKKIKKIQFKKLFNSKNFKKNSIQKIIQFNKWGSTDIGWIMINHEYHIF